MGNKYTIRRCVSCRYTAGQLGRPLSKCHTCRVPCCSQKCLDNNSSAHCPPRRLKRFQIKSTKSNGTNSDQSTPPTAATLQHTRKSQTENKVLDLYKADYLLMLPEKQVFGQLIDCFRMRLGDENAFVLNELELRKGLRRMAMFRNFLILAEGRGGILPKWWNNNKRILCELLASQHPLAMTEPEDSWYNIHVDIGPKDIINHYGNGMKAMNLRWLGERIYGTFSTSM